MATQTKDYYGTLGVKKTATSDEIRKAFRKLARKHHPDVNPGDKKSEEKFKEISEANDVLSDDKKRKIFDQLGFYSDNIDPAAAEAASRGGYGGGFDGSPRAGRGGQEGPRSTLAASTSPAFRVAGRTGPGVNSGFGGSFKDVFSGMFNGGRQARGTAARAPTSSIQVQVELLDRDPRRRDAPRDPTSGAVPNLQGPRGRSAAAWSARSATVRGR